MAIGFMSAHSPVELADPRRKAFDGRSAIRAVPPAPQGRCRRQINGSAGRNSWAGRHLDLGIRERPGGGLGGAGFRPALLSLLPIGYTLFRAAEAVVGARKFLGVGRNEVWEMRN